MVLTAAKWLMFRLETQTTYQAGLPSCGPTMGPNSAAVLTHFAARNEGQSSYEPDRITFCEWLMDHLMVESALPYGIWDTRKSIYGIRAKVDEMDDWDGNIDMAEFRTWRDAWMTPESGLPDIDVSIGFDTFLTSVVGRYHLALGCSKYADPVVLARTHFCRRFQGSIRWHWLHVASAIPITPTASR